MNEPPPYFEGIRLKAENRWRQLEDDPELAGPWHQLFKQVQSPRHVISELLQNADDAGATSAAVRLEDDLFIFEHNGSDFTDQQFGSLCRFGYSNKRNLHTIGFRGIGFKSTFSLGDIVELQTPSLSVCFHKRHFTEPIWLDRRVDTLSTTQIRVLIKDQNRRREIEKNLEEWHDSPSSLLFFKTVRRIDFGGRGVEWTSLGPGEVFSSEWFCLNDNPERPLLLVRSGAEEFPLEALEEIRQERSIGMEDEADFPASKVEIVLGDTGGSLYVVLPTGVDTGLPFACNGPFIQDPARLKIKDPEISPANRWLLARAGALAATAMLEWLERSESANRADAYQLLPERAAKGNALENLCAEIAKEAFLARVAHLPILLTVDGSLVESGDSVIIPSAILEVWEPGQVVSLFDDAHRAPLSTRVSSPNRKKLLAWGLVVEVDKDLVLDILRRKHLPKPGTWQQLLNLWAYVAPEATSFRLRRTSDDLNIVPAQGKEVLYSAKEVVRLGEKKLLQSDDDWNFLGEYLVVVNPNWPRFLSAQRRKEVEIDTPHARHALEAVFTLLTQLKLEETSDANEVINQVAVKFFERAEVPISECVRLAQIAAKLGATTGDSFNVVSADRKRRRPAEAIFDEDGTLEELIPDQRRDSQLLHRQYSTDFASCSPDEWRAWARSTRSRLLTYLPTISRTEHIYGWDRIQQEAAKRGIRGELGRPYRTTSFVIRDSDFDREYWAYWKSLYAHDPYIWTKLLDRMLQQPGGFARAGKGATVLQVATTGSQSTISPEAGFSAWLLRLRELPCLLDNRNTPRKPDELLRKTPETESLLDVEPFVHGRLDREDTRGLLDLLGVRSTPAGPDRFIEYLRGFSGAAGFPSQEVDKWYRRLDQMLATCSTEDVQRIKDIFRGERLILSAEGVWSDSTSVFLRSDENDVPGAAVIRPSVAELSLWRRIGIAERPTLNLALIWLKALESGKSLPADDSKRVRALMTRYAAQIWEECGHWLNLAGEWCKTENLAYALTMQSLVQWRHLHPWVKQKTADLQKMSSDVASGTPFQALRTLSSQIEDRFDQRPLFAGEAVTKSWLKTFGDCLACVELDDVEETRRVRREAKRLAQTTWREAAGLEIIPYLNGVPAGTPRQADVVWTGEWICVAQLPAPKLARVVPDELAKTFASADIREALIYSYDRSADQVREYLTENFRLRQVAAVDDTVPIEPVASDASPEFDTAHPADGLPNPTWQEPKESPVPVFKSERTLKQSPDESASSDSATGANGWISRPAAPPSPAQPSLVELFAIANGFQKDGGERFFHKDGSWLSRGLGNVFPWERYNATGELVRYYLPENHCLEEEPLALKADTWALMERRPDLYALILKRLNSAPVELSGATLLAMRDRGEITLYPARYRIVLGNIVRD